MPSILPINLDDLLRLNGVESSRVEFKASWDEKTTGPQVITTICAYANDFQNLNGGYIVIGVAEQDGVAVLPPQGLSDQALETAQFWIRGRCNTIDPVYQPVLSPEVFEGVRILVIWAPAGDARPYQAYSSTDKGAMRSLFVRLGSETVNIDKQTDLKTQLLQLTARVPFDDRRALHAKVENIRESKVREFLNDVGSGLLEEVDSRTLYRNLRIADQVNGHDAPRNIGLLFFSQNPEVWFPGARIEVVHFTDDVGGDLLPEMVFHNRPIQEQLRDCLTYLEGLTVRMIQKLPNRSSAGHWVSYPSPALREALVNAVYHRSYDGVYEPIKVYLYPDRIEVISYPGPMPGIELKHLEGLEPLPPVPARNRRIGELLKELKLAEGRGTGIPKVRRSMQKNGSPPPRFDFDASRSYFRVTLPVHPEYQAILTLQDVAHMRAMGDAQAVMARLKEAHAANPGVLGICIELAREFVAKSDIHGAQEVYEHFVASRSTANAAPLITLIAKALLDSGNFIDAISWLDRLPILDAVEDAIDAAIQEKRAGRLEAASRYFIEAGNAVSVDAKALHEFAQVKIRLADKAAPKRRDGSLATYRRILTEARDMLSRVVQMDAPRTRRAWAWYDLGRVLEKLGTPLTETRHAYSHAAQLEPEERRFSEALDRLSQNKTDE